MNYRKILENATTGSGIAFNGPNPWDPKIHDDKFYEMVVKYGTLGLGEAYMLGIWDCDQLDVLFYKVLRANAKDKLPSNFQQMLRGLYSKFINLQTKNRAPQVGKKHYDAGNNLFQQMLDPLMTYTCGYWGAGAKTLAEAQEHKLKMVCEKLNLPESNPYGMLRILDIGCGWGSLARYAAKHYDVEVTGVTISKEQIALGNELCAGQDIKLRFQDYRDVDDGPYDCIVSLGMFEHVGPKNYREFFQTTHRLLKPGGRFLLHTIGGMNSVMDTDPWIEKYIFPNSVIPSMAQIMKASEGLFLSQDQHNFGTDYDRTLMEWHKNIDAGWSKLSWQEYNFSFRRMWEYYLLTCAASFRAQYNHLFQIVFTKGFQEKIYRSKRFDKITV